MMNGYKIYLDGVDISQYGTPAGYSVGYQFEDGGQGGLMLSGAERVDELAKWPVITFPCMPLTDGQLQELFSLVLSVSTHSLNYYDPEKGQRTIRVKRSVSTPKYKGKGVDGNLYWTGVTVTFRGIDNAND